MRLVLLHALPFDGRMWQAEMDLVPGRTSAPTLYGLGSSIEEWAHGALDLVGDGPCIVVGCSMGGSCALEVARAAPEQVMGVVLVGAKAGVRPDPAFRDEALRVLATGGTEAGWLTYWEPLLGRNVPDATRAAARTLALVQDVEDVIRGVRAFHDRRDLTEFALSWPRPVIVISGDQDRTPLPATAALVADGPGRSAHVVEDCGHWVNLEQPDRFRQLVTAAIERIAPTARS